MAAVLLMLCFIAVAFLGVIDANHVTIQTNEGAVRGTTETVLGEEINTFWGIPYAEPPVGSRRFKAPKAKGGWKGTLDALEKPLSCVQSGALPNNFAEIFALNTKESEDCLYLNVWAPASTTALPRAVMVWIHGGVFTMGSSTLDFYDGSILAAKYDVVVVSMQYRLNVFGFLYLGTEEAPGNMGLMDQQMALHWVQNNIASFQGDPSRVTIFGQSAGAASAQLHMLSPGSKDLFSNVILESGSVLAEWTTISKDDARAQSDAIIASLKCDLDDGYNCLMSKDPESLTTALGPDCMLLPVIDGHFIPGTPIDMLKGGDFTSKNILTGTNRDDGTFILLFMLPEIDERQPDVTISRKSFEEFLGFQIKSTDPEVLSKVGGRYGVPADDVSSSQMIRALIDVITDTLFVCPQVAALEALVQHSNAVYEYVYTSTPATSPFPSWMGATHAAEIVDVFGLPFQKHRGNSDEEKRFSEVIMGYWTNFAKTGNPNQGDFEVPLEWLPHTGEEYQHIVLQTPEVAMRNGYREGQCEFLAEISSSTFLHEEL